ncbi:MAG: L,D-transpeptidase [Vicinamibacterales bacterium]
MPSARSAAAAQRIAKPAAKQAAQQPATKQAAKKKASPQLDEQTLRTQVMLDRAGFSPGEIDGRMGTSTKRAMEAFTSAGGTLDTAVEPLATYKITPEDAAGPFTVDLPADMMEKSKLPALGFRDLAEAMGERFHVSPALLKRLNPQTTFAVGEDVRVPNVEVIPPARMPAPAGNPSAAPAPLPADAASPATGAPSAAGGTAAAGAAGRAGQKTEAASITITVRKSTSDLTVTDAAGKAILYAPVTTGSEHDPLPIGTWKVNGVQKNPTFHYNPELFWDADPTHAKAKIPAGPNNPVGVVWIDISREHYGLHGTPEPATVGKTSSHGCVRLTNWDAQKLAALVRPGTKVIFAE